MTKFLKHFLKIISWGIFSFTVFRWLAIFFFISLILPPFFLFQVIKINYQYLTFDIYSTKFPLVYMNSEFGHLYKTLRFDLTLLVNFLSFLFFLLILVKINPLEFDKYPGKLRLIWLKLKQAKYLKQLILSLSILFILFLFLYNYLILPVYTIAATAKNIIDLPKEMTPLLKDRNFTEAEARLKQIQKEIQITQNNLKRLAWFKSIPLANNYYNDAVYLTTAGNYALESGLAGMSILPSLSLESFQKTEELIPQAEEILGNLPLIKEQIDHINPKHYPKKIKGRVIREKIISAKNKIDQLEEARQSFQPLLKVLPDLAGFTQPKRYLVIFQDENELRPTGGLMTAFGIFRIEKGKIIRESSGNIDYFGRSLQNANTSPDFFQSMKNFERIYRNSYGRVNFDGIFAIDGELFVNLLDVLGPTIVYDYTLRNETNLLCQCPAIIADIQQLPQNRKKDIVGVFLNGLLAKTTTSGLKTQLEVFLALFKSIPEKHLLASLVNPEEQKSIEIVGMAGRIADFEGDYLHFNETNLTGIKEDRLLIREVEDKIKIEPNGEVYKTVVLTYQKPSPAKQTSLLLLRFYLPQGTKLIDLKGIQNQPLTTSDLGKTVFEGQLEIQPETEKEVVLEYRLPFKINSQESYPLLRQKQPGIKGYEYTIFLNGQQKENFFLENDRQFLLNLP